MLAGGAYRLTLDEPEPVAAKPKPHVNGTVYVLDEPVVVDLAGGGYATVTVGLQVASGTETAEAQTGVVREIVTNDLTDVERAELLDRTGATSSSSRSRATSASTPTSSSTACC